MGNLWNENQLPSTLQSLHITSAAASVGAKEREPEKTTWESGKKSHNKFSRIDVAVGNKKHKFYYFIYNKCSNLWCIFMDFQFGSKRIESDRVESNGTFLRSLGGIYHHCLLPAWLLWEQTKTNRTSFFELYIAELYRYVMMMAGRTDGWFHGARTTVVFRYFCDAGWLDAFAPSIFFTINQPTYHPYTIHYTPMIYGRHNNFSFIKELYE